MDRTYGPVLGAGTQVKEVAPNKEIVPGILGTTVMMGVLERGIEGDISLTPTKASVLRKNGGILDPADFNACSFASLESPLAARHFYDHSEGAGYLVNLRAVPRTVSVSRDDTPDSSQLLVFNRESTPKYIGYLEAKNGGRWGGQREAYLGKITGVPVVDFPSDNYLQLDGLAAKTLKYDEYKGGTLHIHGITTKTYEIVANEPTGLIILASDVDLPQDWNDAGPPAAETSGTVTGNVAGPTWRLSNGGTIEVHCDEAVGGPDTATITGTAARLVGGATGLPVGMGDTITFECDKIPGSQLVTMAAAHANVEDVAADINEQVRGFRAIVVGGATIDFESDTIGTSSSIAITANTGGVAAEIGHVSPSDDTGTGNVADMDAVTLAELETIIEAAVTNPATGVSVTLAAGNFLRIASNTTGLTSSIQIEVASTLDDELGLDNVKHDGAAPALLSVTIHRDNINARGQEKYLGVVFKDGLLDPTGKFCVRFYVDGELYLKYDDLSMDTTSPYYWEDVINNDVNNDIVTVVDSFSGSRSVETARPANRAGLSKALSTSVLTIDDPFIYSVNSFSGDWVPTITAITYGAQCKPQVITITVTDVVTGALTVTTSIGNRTYTGTYGVPITMDEYMITVTVGAGAGTDTNNDYFNIYVRPLVTDELIGGLVYSKVDTFKSYVIIDNTVNTVTINAASDLTESGSITAGEDFRLEWVERFGSGFDGYIPGMTTSDYEVLLDPDTSPLRKLLSMNLGLVKLSIPGIAGPSAALALQRKAKALAVSYGWQFRVELEDTMSDEVTALSWVNNSLGRTDGDVCAVFYPSFMYIRDPLAIAGSDARERLVSVTGMQLGREAKVARQHGGYHKAGAGIDVTLPLVTRSDVLGYPDRPTRVNEELLNPAGINCYRWAGGSIVAWGDRSLDNTTQYMWKHKREQLSHYIQILLQNFDWSIFQINDPESDADVITALYAYFKKEYTKRAIVGDSFINGRNPALILKMDKENNTTATRNAGDQNVALSVQLANTVERLKISIGITGITESI